MSATGCPIKIFIINNGGYHSIRQTQKNFFGEPLIGIGVDSGDLGFPSMEKLAWAYGFPYVAIHGNKELGEKVEETLAMDGPVICEVFVTLDQNFEPKSAAKRLPDGTGLYRRRWRICPHSCRTRRWTVSC